jgi:hypothetical protein
MLQCTKIHGSYGVCKVVEARVLAMERKVLEGFLKHLLDTSWVNDNSEGASEMLG